MHLEAASWTNEQMYGTDTLRDKERAINNGWYKKKCVVSYHFKIHIKIHIKNLRLNWPPTDSDGVLMLFWN